MGEVDSTTLLSVPPGDPSQVSTGRPCVLRRGGWDSRGPSPESALQTVEHQYGPAAEGADASAEDGDAGEHPLGRWRAVVGAAGRRWGWGAGPG